MNCSVNKYLVTHKFTASARRADSKGFKVHSM